MTLNIGGVTLGTPVVLAPMAGVTDPPFRALCRTEGLKGLPDDARARLSSSGLVAPSGLYVTEMITTRALVERTPETMRMIEPDPGDPVRSVQLYGVDPDTVAEATRILIDEDFADHIDLNFGCPVPKVTRKGGGAALPWKKDLFEQIVRAAVASAERSSHARDVPVPVTIKIRIGIDDSHVTFLDASRIAANAGVAGITLHARTLAEYYSGHSHWDQIARLRDAMPANLPVLGNGDVFSAENALDMMEQTGADGVVIGRGAQGRPWLFTDVVAAMHGSDLRVRPTLGDVARMIRAHAVLAIEHFADEGRALREMRKHIGWYLRGFPVGGESRRDLQLVDSLADLDEKLATLDWEAPFPEAAEGRRGRGGGAKIPHLPDGWLNSPLLNDTEREGIADAEIDASGG